jgi:hypothetical protein
MSDKPYAVIRREIDLPLLTAVWVLFAHVFTILSPLVVIVVIIHYQDFLQTVMYSPRLLIWSSGLFVAASIFESAQNTFDRWYLVDEPPTLCDFMFNNLLIWAMSLAILAYAGDLLWLWWLAAGLSLFAPIAYLMAWPSVPFRAIAGLLSLFAAYRSLQDPVLVLSLVTTFLTLFFLNILLTTKNQAVHGIVTIVNAFGLLMTPLAIYQNVNQQPSSWLMVVLLSVAVIGSCLLLRKTLLKLPPTPRLAV